MYIRKDPKANLENKRKVFLEIGFILTLLLVFAAFQYRSYETNTIDLPPDHSSEEIEELVQIIKEKPKLPKPPPISQTLLKPVENSTDVIEDIEIDVGIDIGWEAPEYYSETREVEDFVPDDILFAIAEKNANFPGGLPAFYEYLRLNLKYPAYAIEVGKTGTVYIEFVVEKDGSITNVILKRGIGGGCDEAAIKIIENMPPWNPAIQNGRKVRFKLIQPVKFTLR